MDLKFEGERRWIDISTATGFLAGSTFLFFTLSQSTKWNGKEGCGVWRRKKRERGGGGGGRDGDEEAAVAEEKIKKKIG